MTHVHLKSISGFEYEILLIRNCKLLYKMQPKESQKNEYTIMHDHTPGPFSLRLRDSVPSMHGQSSHE